MLKCMPRKGRKTKAIGSSRKQMKPVKKVVRLKRMTPLSSHYPPALKCLIGEVILMMAKCAYALLLSPAKFTLLQNRTSP